MPEPARWPQVTAASDEYRRVRLSGRFLHDRETLVQALSELGSGYWVLTGYPYGPGSARQIKPTDWPYFGSIVKMLRPSETMPALTSVWIPDLMRLNDSVTPAGQTAGFLGRAWEPERFVGDPATPDYRIEGLDLPAIKSLLAKVTSQTCAEFGDELTAVLAAQRREVEGRLAELNALRDDIEVLEAHVRHCCDGCDPAMMARDCTFCDLIQVEG